MSRAAPWLGLLTLGVLIIAAAVALPIELDEAYYWCWSRALGWTYVDHPPGIAWALALSTIFGSVRVLSVLAILIVVLASAASARRLTGDPWLAVSTLSGAAMLTIGYLPATPDPLQGATMAAAAYALVRSDDRRWAFLAGVVLGAAVLFKHSSALIALGAVLGLLRTGRQRLWPLLLGLLVTGVVIVPWILADLEAGSLWFQGHRVFSDAPTRWLAAPALLVGAMVATSGPAAIAQLFQLYGDRRTQDPVRAALSTGALVLLLGCGIAAGLGTGEINWPFPALVFGLPAVIAWLRERRSLVLFRRATILSAIAGAIILLHVIHPFLPIPPDKDRTLRSAGFDQITTKALALAQVVGAQVLIARRYQGASMLRYHGQDRLPVLELSTGRPSQFDRWPHPSVCEGELAVLVLNHAGLSEELIGHADLAGETLVIDRGRGDRVVDQWYVTPVRMHDSSLCGGRP